MTAAEIAGELYLSVGTVTNAISDARKRKDSRAVERRAKKQLSVSFADSQRGTLVNLATTCLLYSSATDPADVAPLLRAAARNVQRQASGPPSDKDVDLGPDQAQVAAIQRAAHIGGRFGHGSALPFPMELAEELGILQDSPIRVPAAWFSDLAGQPSVTTSSAYALGEALFSVVEHVDSIERLDRLVQGAQVEHPNAVGDTIRTLYSVAAQSPRVGARAVHLLGRLGVLALDPSGRNAASLERFLYDSPLGYRAMRVASRLLFRPPGMDQTGTDYVTTGGWLHRDVQKRVTDLLHLIHNRPPPELYPDRSLVVETLFKMPTNPSSDPDVARWLSERALDTMGGPSRPPRERAFALVVLASRFPDVAEEVRRDLAVVEETFPGFKHLHEQVQIILDDARQRTSLMPDLPELPDTIETQLIQEKIDRACDRHFADGHTQADQTRIIMPAEARASATKVLQCAFGDRHGTRRRRALDTLRHSGMGALVSEIGLDIVNTITEENDPNLVWVAGQATFAVSFSHQAGAVNTLVDLARYHLDKPDSLAIVVSALHAVGDIGLSMTYAADSLFGLTRVAQDAVDRGNRPPSISRAASYALSTVRHYDRRPPRNVEQTLSDLAESGDSLTASMARWGLHRYDLRANPASRRIPDVFGV